MTLEDYADALNTQIIVQRYQCQRGRWVAHFACCDVIEGKILSSSYGEGTTPLGAMNSYTEKIRGTRIVFDAASPEKRREFDVPETLNTIGLLDWAKP